MPLAKQLASPIDRIRVKSYSGLGKLFIDWATDPTKPPPADLAGFVKAVVDTDLVYPLPDYIRSFTTVQSRKEDLLLRLPPAELVKDTLDHIKDPYSYPEEIYGQLIIDDNLEFFRGRVGDYTIAHCS